MTSIGLSQETFARRLFFDSENLKALPEKYEKRAILVTILWLSNLVILGTLLGFILMERFQ